MKTYTMPMQNKPIRKFIQIGQWESGQIYGENFLGENFTGGGGKFRGEFWEQNENLQNGVAK